MTDKDPHAVAMGQRSGQVRSDAKRAASRANGRRGGRPSFEHRVRAAFGDLDSETQTRVVDLLRSANASYLLTVIGVPH